MAEQIEMPFGLWTRVGPRKNVLCGVHIGAAWTICVWQWQCGLFVKLLWPLVIHGI